MMKKQTQIKIKRIPASRDLLKRRHKHLFKALHGYMSRYRKKIKHSRMQP